MATIALTATAVGWMLWNTPAEQMVWATPADDSKIGEWAAGDGPLTDRIFMLAFATVGCGGIPAIAAGFACYRLAFWFGWREAPTPPLLSPDGPPSEASDTN